MKIKKLSNFLLYGDRVSIPNHTDCVCVFEPVTDVNDNIFCVMYDIKKSELFSIQGQFYVNNLRYMPPHEMRELTINDSDVMNMYDNWIKNKNDR
jgi:hypothetical protein